MAENLPSVSINRKWRSIHRSPTDGFPLLQHFSYFNLRRLQAKSKVHTEVLDELLFADDIAKGAPTEEKMQKGVDQVSDSCDSYDLTISIKKTEVVYQPAPGKP